MLHNVYNLNERVQRLHLGLVCSSKSSSCIVKCKDMTLAISNNVFQLHTRTQNMQESHLLFIDAHNL